MIGPDSTKRGLLEDWDLSWRLDNDNGVARLRELRRGAEFQLLDARAEAALRDRDCAMLRENPKGTYAVGDPFAAQGAALALVRHLERQIARINERLRALGEKP